MATYAPLAGFSVVKATSNERATYAMAHPDRPIPHRLVHDACGERLWAAGRYTGHISRCAKVNAVLDQLADEERIATEAAAYGQPPHLASFDPIFDAGVPVLDHQLIEATAVPQVRWCYLATRKHNAVTFRIDLTRYAQTMAESFADMLRGPWVGYAEVRVLDAGRVDAFIAAGIITPVTT